MTVQLELRHFEGALFDNGTIRLIQCVTSELETRDEDNDLMARAEAILTDAGALYAAVDDDWNSYDELRAIIVSAIQLGLAVGR